MPEPDGDGAAGKEANAAGIEAAGKEANAADKETIAAGVEIDEFSSLAASEGVVAASEEVVAASEVAVGIVENEQGERDGRAGDELDDAITKSMDEEGAGIADNEAEAANKKAEFSDVDKSLSGLSGSTIAETEIKTLRSEVRNEVCSTM